MTSASGMVTLIHGNELDGTGFPKDESGLFWGGSNCEISASSPKFGSGCIFSTFGAGVLNHDMTDAHNFLSDDFTIEAWVKMDIQDTVRLFALGSQSNESGAYGYRYLINWTYTHTYAVFEVVNDGVTIFYEEQDIGSCLTSGVWCHLCFVKEGTKAYAFVNGTLEYTFNDVPATMPDIDLNTNEGSRIISLL